MRTTYMIIALVLVPVAGCFSDSWEKVQRERNQWNVRATEVIKSIKDRESAIKARPQLVQLIKEKQQLDARSKKLGKMTPEEEKDLKDKLYEEAKTTSVSYAKALQHLILAVKLKEAREELEKEINVRKMTLK